MEEGEGGFFASGTQLPLSQPRHDISAIGPNKGAHKPSSGNAAE
jgi:hypothetical protein